MCALKNIRELCRAGAEAHAAGDAVNAEFFLRQAYVRARALPSPVLEAKILNTMGAFALEDNRPHAAVPFLRQARKKVDARIGRDNTLYHVISDNLLQAEVAAITGSCAVARV